MYNSSGSEKKLLIDQSSRKLIDATIKKRLSSEMPHIRQSIKDLVKQQDPFKDRNPEPIVKKRLVSIGQVEKEKVRRSISYKAIPNFVGEVPPDFDMRKKLFESPIIPFEDGQELNKARLIPQNLYVKMADLTKPKYESNIKAATERALEILEPSLNIAGKHYMVSVLDSHPIPKRSLSIELSSKNSFIKKQAEDENTVELYQPKKYNKMDMEKLSTWFDDAINTINEEKLPDEQHFRKIYGAYIATFKQFIRLTYIDSIDRACLLEKTIWSFVSLLDKMMEIQHIINYDQFKEHQTEFREMKELFEEREAGLTDKVNNLTKQLEQINHKYNRLVVVFMSYKTINKELVYEIEQFAKTYRELQRAHEHLKHQHFKLLKQLNESGRIEEMNQKYYVVNKYSQPDVISHFVQGNEHFDIFRKEAENVDIVESQLAKYWSKIEDDMTINKMIHYEDLFPKTSEVCIQSQSIVTFYDEVGIQNYSLCSHVSDVEIREEDKFQNFLSAELKQEKKQEDRNVLVVSLQELYDQVYTDNLRLKGTNAKLVEENKKSDDYNNTLLQEMSQLRKKNLWQETVVKEARLELDTLHRQLSQKTDLIVQLREKLKQTQENLKSQRYNNECFVKNELDLRKRIEKMDKEQQAKQKQHELQLSRNRIKITRAVKLVDQYLDLIEDNSDSRYIEIGQKLQQVFKEELNREEKDANVFITK